MSNTGEKDEAEADPGGSGLEALAAQTDEIPIPGPDEVDPLAARGPGLDSPVVSPAMPQGGQRPQRPSSPLDRAVALQRAGRVDEAIQAYDAMLATAPGDARAWLNLGVALRARNRLEAAGACYRRAIALDPQNAGAHSNLGNVLRLLGRHQEATQCQHRALELDPSYHAAAYNMALVLHDVRLWREALRYFDRALAGGYDRPEVRLDRAQSLLAVGDYARGFAELEHRLRVPGAPPRPATPWTGGPVDGKSILVQLEAGARDTLMFLRYLPALASRGARVIVAAPAPMVGMIAPIQGVAEVYVPGARQPPATDFHVMLNSLPYLFGTTTETVPSAMPYLAVPGGREPRQWLPPIAGANVKVGVVWADRAGDAQRDDRSCPFGHFLRLAGVPGVVLYRLQTGPAAADRDRAGAAALVRDIAGDFRDLADAAEAIAALDLVIGVDSAAMVLAGALGKPGFVALPTTADWRWTDDPERTPWLPTFRLFRQRRPGDWDDVFARIAEALSAFVSNAHPTAAPVPAPPARPIAPPVPTHLSLASAPVPAPAPLRPRPAAPVPQPVAPAPPSPEPPIAPPAEPSPPPEPAAAPPEPQKPEPAIAETSEPQLPPAQPAAPEASVSAPEPAEPLAAVPSAAPEAEPPKPRRVPRPRKMPPKPPTPAPAAVVPEAGPPTTQTEAAPVPMAERGDNADQGGHAFAVRRFIDEHLEPGDTLIDLGVGDGLFTLSAAARHAGGVHVSAFDANAERLNELRQAAERSRVLASIELINATLGAQTVAGRADAPPAMTLDAVLHDRPARKGRVFLRLDSGGREPEIVAGGIDLLASGRIAAIVWRRAAAYDEPAGAVRFTRLLDDLAGLGFRHFRLPDDNLGGPLVPYAGLAEPATIFTLPRGFVRRRDYSNRSPQARPSSDAGRYATLDAAARRTRTAALKLAKTSDAARWADPANLEDGAAERAALAAAHVSTAARVLDVGAGAMRLKPHLPAGATYVAADLVPRGPDTVVIDLNQGDFPAGLFDTVAMLDVLEFLHDPHAALERTRAAASNLVLTYRVTTTGDTDARAASGCFNAFSRSELEAQLAMAGWVVATHRREGRHDLFVCHGADKRA